MKRRTKDGFGIAKGAKSLEEEKEPHEELWQKNSISLRGSLKGKAKSFTRKEREEIWKGTNSK